MNRAAFAAVLAASMLAAGTGRAQVTDGTEFLGAVPQSESKGQLLTVESETVDIRCTAQGTVLDCSSVSILDVTNEGPTTAFTFEADKLATNLTVNDVAVELRASTTRLRKTANVTLAVGRSTIALSFAHAFRRDAGAEAAQVFGHLFEPVIVTRHPLMSQYPGNPAGAEIIVPSVGTMAIYKAVQKTRVTVTYPAAWQPKPTVAMPKPPPACDAGDSTPCSRTLDTGEHRIEWDWPAQGRAPFAQSFVFAPPGRVLVNGGFLVGGGMGAGAGCAGCWDAIRARLGYEVGIGAYAILALVGEYSPSSRFSIVPTIDGGFLPQIGWVPAMSFGLGVPVRVNPDPAVGARGQLTAAWRTGSALSLGFVLTLDILANGGGGEKPVGGAALQAGF